MNFGRRPDNRRAEIRNSIIRLSGNWRGILKTAKLPKTFRSSAASIAMTGVALLFEHVPAPSVIADCAAATLYENNVQQEPQHGLTPVRIKGFGRLFDDAKILPRDRKDWYDGARGLSQPS